MKTKPKKKTFIGDTFEQLSDTTSSTVKKAGVSVIKTFNPLDAFNEEQSDKQEAMQKAKETFKKEKQNFTPIDLKDFEKNYESQDGKQAEELRQRLFKLVKEGEKEALEARKREEDERKKKDEDEKQQKKKQGQETKIRNEEGSLPRGKQRRSIFSPRKKAQEQHSEYKPSGGQG